jgi:hypothetical protein
LISPWQGRSLHTGQHKHRINAHTHRYPCLEWDSNHESSVRASEESFLCFRPRSHRDLRVMRIIELILPLTKKEKPRIFLVLLQYFFPRTLETSDFISRSATGMWRNSCETSVHVKYIYVYIYSSATKSDLLKIWVYCGLHLKRFVFPCSRMRTVAWHYISKQMKSAIFWNIAPSSPLKVNGRFGVKCRLHLQGRISKNTRMKAGSMPRVYE